MKKMNGELHERGSIISAWGSVDTQDEFLAAYGAISATGWTEFVRLPY